MTMKKFVLISGLAVIFAGTFLDPNPVMAADAKNKTAVKAATKTKLKVKKIRHVVCFKFKEDATKEQVAKVEKAFEDLKKKKKNKAYATKKHLNEQPRQQTLNKHALFPLKAPLSLKIYKAQNQHVYKNHPPQSATPYLKPGDSEEGPPCL